MARPDARRFEHAAPRPRPASSAHTAQGRHGDDDGRDVISEGWYLEGFVDGDSVPRRYGIGAVPFRIGRLEEQDLYLPVADISGAHAELFVADGQLQLRDLGSSNGTFVNGARLTAPRVLREGDVLHFASREFVVGRRGETPAEHLETMVMHAPVAALPRRNVTGTEHLRQLLREEAVAAVFQPIVRLADGTCPHFEMLGRGAHSRLPTSPMELFRIASALDREAELSRLFRRAGLRDGALLPGAPGLFFNTHPEEMRSAELLTSLAAWRESHPHLELTVEVSEAAVTSPERMRRLHDAFRALGMRTAYDDFGAGQARLLELVEIPPDYLKFDICLVRDIHRAGPPKRKLVQSLVTVARDMGIACIAEGIESREELEFCLSAGMEYGQGYLLGRPAPLEAWCADGVVDRTA